MLLADAGADSAAKVGARILDAVRELQLPHAASDTAGHVSISLGISTCMPEGHLDPLHLIRAADTALYRAKAEGRNRLSFLAVDPTLSAAA